jgi:tetratricopeptide (TPR) repeat protein
VDLYVSAGENKKAEQALERASKLQSADPKFWVQLADLHARLYLKEDGSSQPADLAKMNTLYRRAAELGQKDPAVLAKVGDFFVLSRQVKEAIPFYLSALNQKSDSEDPTPNSLREKLARAFLLNADRDEAIRLLEDVVKDNPMRFETLEMLGELYEEKGELEKALPHFERSLLLDGSEPGSFMRIAGKFLRAKQPDKAIAIMRDARLRYPDKPEIALSLAFTLSQAKQHEEAVAAFEEAYGEAKGSHDEILSAEFFFQFGAVAEQAGLVEKAAGLLKKSIAMDPANASQAYNYLGYMWADRGENLAEAGEMLKKALEMDPDNGAFLDSQGWLFFKRGEFENAYKELLRASALIKPEDSTVFDHLGDTCQALGKDAEALGFWQKALSLEKDNKKIAAKIQQATAPK